MSKIDLICLQMGFKYCLHCGRKIGSKSFPVWLRSKEDENKLNPRFTFKLPLLLSSFPMKKTPKSLQAALGHLRPLEQIPWVLFWHTPLGTQQKSSAIHKKSPQAGNLCSSGKIFPNDSITSFVSPVWSFGSC